MHQKSLFCTRKRKIDESNRCCGLFLDINAVPDAVNLKTMDCWLRNNNIVNYLNNDGDFRSLECLKLLNEADVVVTNPPFSLFINMVDILSMYNKDFILLGPLLAIGYNNMKLNLVQNKYHIGYNRGTFIFDTPDGCDKVLAAIRWYSNIPHTINAGKSLILNKRYTHNANNKFDNSTGGLVIDKICDIPFNYTKAILVPITIIDFINTITGELTAEVMCKDSHNCSCKFKLVGLTNPFVDGNEGFIRVIIKKI